MTGGDGAAERTNRRQAAERRGRWAEAVALVLLRLTGWRIEARRFRAVRGSGAGEIDLIARRGRLLAFIEVKSRADGATALAALTPRQRARIARGAEAFIARRPDLAGFAMRFDAVVVRPWRLPHHLTNVWRVGD